MHLQSNVILKSPWLPSAQGFISDSKTPCFARSVALPILKLCGLKCPWMPLNWRVFCSMQLNWYLDVALSSIWVKRRGEPLSGRRRKNFSTQLTGHVSALGCLDMCNVVAFPIWSVFDLGIKILTLFPSTEMCALWMAKTSLTLSKPWYVMEKIVENKTLS